MNDPGQREARLTNRPDGCRAHFLKLSATGVSKCRWPDPHLSTPFDVPTGCLQHQVDTDSVWLPPDR